MSNKSVKSEDLLQKVYDHLDTIDVTKLTMHELSDFLEVVQKGRFLETIGSNPFPSFGGYGFNKPVAAELDRDTESE